LYASTGKDGLSKAKEMAGKLTEEDRATAAEAYKDRDASCHAVRLGNGWGFVCGVRDGATTVHAFAPPLSMKL
jgi:hypothetical protein